MLLNEYVRIIRKFWWALLAGLVGGALLGVAASALIPKTYTSTAVVMVTANNASSAIEMSESGGFITSRMKTYSTVATSPLVLRKVIDSLKLDEDVTTLGGALTALSPSETSLIEITAEDSDPALATATVNETAKQFAATLPKVEQGSKGDLLKVTILQPGVEPDTAATPNQPLNVALGGMLGLLLCASALFGLGAHGSIAPPSRAKHE